MKIKKILVWGAVVVVLATGIGGFFGFMSWHNKEMENLQKKCDSAVKAAQEEDERCKEVEASLHELANTNKDLEDRIETIINNRDAWKEKSKKLENTLNELKKKISVKDTVIESTEIEHTIREINELAVIEYSYRQTSFIDEHDKFRISILDGTNIPFTGKKCVISMDGKIKVGIDADKIAVEIDNASKKISIGLPASKVLSNELDENSLYVYLEEESVFNQVKAQDHSDLRQKIKNESQKFAKDNGVMEQSDERVKQLIQTMLNQIPEVNDNYTIEFKTIK